MNRAQLLDVDGDRDRSLAEYGRARRLFDGLTADYPENVDYRFELANCMLKLGQFHRDDATAARKCYQAALDHALALVADHPDAAENRFLASQAAMCEANIIAAVDAKRAAECYRIAREQVTALLELRPDDRRPATMQAAILFNEGMMLAEQGSYDVAVAKLTEARDLSLRCVRAAGSTEPTRPR